MTKEHPPRIVPMARKSLNTHEAAEMAEVSIGTIRYWLKQGLKHSRPGKRGHIRIRPEDLEEFMLIQEHSPPASNTEETDALPTKDKRPSPEPDKPAGESELS